MHKRAVSEGKVHLKAADGQLFVLKPVLEKTSSPLDIPIGLRAAMLMIENLFRVCWKTLSIKCLETVKLAELLALDDTAFFEYGQKGFDSFGLIAYPELRLNKHGVRLLLP